MQHLPANRGQSSEGLFKHKKDKLRTWAALHHKP